MKKPSELRSITNAAAQRIRDEQTRRKEQEEQRFNADCEAAMKRIAEMAEVEAREGKNYCVVREIDATEYDFPRGAELSVPTKDRLHGVARHIEALLHELGYQTTLEPNKTNDPDYGGARYYLKMWIHW